MPKYVPEIKNARREKIVDACETLYQSRTFSEITFAEIGKECGFTRTSIYTYFHTKEEIFLALLQREYGKWVADLENVASVSRLSVTSFAKKLSKSLDKRVQLLKLVSMNLYAIEENSRLENLVEFKKTYKAAIGALENCLKKLKPELSEAGIEAFIYQFLPFMFGLYPYSFPSVKQKSAMKKAGMKLKKNTVAGLANAAVLKLLEKNEK
jgi:AcrR family transcriptional regulator